MKRREFLAAVGAMGAASAVRPALGATVDDALWTDATRRREVPVRVRWPDGPPALPSGQRPLVLFSHGLGGSRAGGEVWGDAWAAAGCVVAHLQHHGSDLEAVRANPRAAMSVAQWRERIDDVRFVLDEVQRRHAAGDGRWAEVRPDRAGMSGHSFGAHTTLAMAGQRGPGWDGVQEPRLAAFIAFSPTLPRGDARAALAPLTRPLLCLTGTRDADVVGNGATPENRRAVFDALPAGDKAQLVLEDADHMTFGGQTERVRGLLGRRPAVVLERQTAHHALVARLTADWWRSYLMDDRAAAARLARPEGLAAGDGWQRK